MNEFAQSFWRNWRVPCIGCVFGFVAGSAFSISIMALRRISLLHASLPVYERIKDIDEKISLPGDIIMRLLKYTPPYPDGSIPWPSVAFVVLSNGAILALFGLVTGWLYGKHHRALQAGQSSGVHPEAPTLPKEQYSDQREQCHWTLIRRGMIFGATTGMLLTVGSCVLVSLSTGETLIPWLAGLGLLLFEPARFLALKLGWDVSAYPMTWSLLLWGMVVNSIAFSFIGVITNCSIRAFYRTIASKRDQKL